MNKIVNSVQEAVADIKDGSTILIGGFAAVGDPLNLLNALVEQGAKDLTIVCSGSTEWPPLVVKEHVRKLIATFVRHSQSHELTDFIDNLVRSGSLETELVSHGILSERIRAAKAGIAGFYVKAGVGTHFAEGKEKRFFDGEEYLLERPILGDFALIKGTKADRFGNTYCRLTIKNYNVPMAGAAKVTIVEVDEIVEPGDLGPEDISIPGIYVDRVVQAPKIMQLVYYPWPQESTESNR